MTEAPPAEPGTDTEAAAPASPAAEDAERPEPPKDDSPADEFGAGDVRAMNAALIHFHGPVNVDGSAAFGVAGEASAGFRKATGVIPVAFVDKALQWFVKPIEYARALAILKVEKAVVLVGADGIGKQTLAFSLLRAVCPTDATLVGVSPAASLTQLAAVTFKAGQGYLVADHIGDRAESAVHSFNADRLAEKIAGRSAHLVITTTSARIGQQLKRYAVTVTMPDPAELLDECLGDASIDAGVLATIRAHIVSQRRPQEIVRLARWLVDDPDAAVRDMENRPVEQVAEWFDGEVTKRDLLSVAALAIAGDQAEPTHDVLVHSLLSHAEPQPGAYEAAPYIAPDDEKIKQRQRDHPLMISIIDDENGVGAWFNGWRVRFRDPAMRLAVLDALYERYDHRLWKCVQTWIDELCGLDPTAVQVPLAQGLALLARKDFRSIYLRFLDRWADGSVNERTTAALVLWFMTEDDQSRNVALQAAMAWGQDRGVRRAVTSALALGGPLGLRFPGEALQRLCFLALRAKRIGVVARLSVALLFNFAVQEGADSTAEVLAKVCSELVRAVTEDGKRAWTGPTPRGDSDSTTPDSYVAERIRLRTTPEEEEQNPDLEPYEHGWSYRIVLAARWLVVDLLCAEHPDRSEPVAVEIVLNQPGNIELLGTLWADVLCSAPHAAAARRGLLRLLLAVEHHPSGTIAVARLGAAVRAAMLPAHRSLRIAELRRQLQREEADQRPSTDLVSALLAAIGHTTAQPTRSRS